MRTHVLIKHMLATGLGVVLVAASGHAATILEATLTARAAACTSAAEYRSLVVPDGGSSIAPLTAPDETSTPCGSSAVTEVASWAAGQTAIDLSWSTALRLGTDDDFVRGSVSLFIYFRVDDPRDVLSITIDLFGTHVAQPSFSLAVSGGLGAPYGLGTTVFTDLSPGIHTLSISQTIVIDDRAYDLPSEGQGAIRVQMTPEPGMGALLVVALAGLALGRRVGFSHASPRCAARGRTAR